MGWDYINAPLGMTPDAYLRASFTMAKPGYTQTPLDTVWVGSTCYMAIRCVSTREDAASGRLDRYCPYENLRDHVAALVILTSGDGKRPGFGYKVMDESMGPAESQAPEAFLARLSPLRGGADIGWARAWRERCRALAARAAA